MAGRTWWEQVGLIAARGREILNLGGRRVHNLESLCRRLLTQRGEASGIALAAEIVAGLQAMDQAETAGFLLLLAADFSPDQERLDAAVRHWQAERDQRSLQRLITAAEPPRQELFRRLNIAPGGTRAILDLRARLLELLPTSPALEAVDADLRHLLGSWFNRGFLQLEEISWRTSAEVLERLILYEAVHEIRGWDDLRRRLAADRRCFAFFHPALASEPLIFVEVALTRGLPAAIGPLLDPRGPVADPAAADSAVFYSISNTQPGLRGISFGNFLIKQVVGQLAAELPNLRRFATLSPVPTLVAGLEAAGPEGFTEARVRALLEEGAAALERLAQTENARAALLALARRPPPHPPAVREALRRVTLAYLLFVRRHGRAADPVANFHLSNGALLERVDVDADTSASGRDSFGVMVNYLYDPDRLEINHERYVEAGEVPLSRALAGERKRLEAAWKSPPAS